MNVALDTFIVFLQNHLLWAYLILFLGSYFETLIVFSLFLYGEIFFLSGGILAGMGVLNIFVVCMVLFLGGILGDSSSYFLGRKFGGKWLLKKKKKTFLTKIFPVEKVEKSKKFLQKHGGKSVFFARFMGPVAWFAPFLAGAHSVPFSSFLRYDVLGASLGIGQFVLAGFLFGKNYQLFLQIVSQWFVAVLFFLLLGGLIYFLYKKKYISHQ